MRNSRGQTAIRYRIVPSTRMVLIVMNWVVGGEEKEQDRSFPVGLGRRDKDPNIAILYIGTLLIFRLHICPVNNKLKLVSFWFSF